MIRIRQMFALTLAAAAGLAAPPPPGMVLIPAGDYRPPVELDPGATARPIPAYFLDVRPVTNTEYLAFVRANPDWRRSRITSLLAEKGYLGDWEGDLLLGAGARADAPVVRVSWFAARAYAAWSGKRLPTTAEWERAAEAGFASERGLSEPAYRQLALAWLSAPAAGPLPAAGSGRANVYGVRDLVDEVWEWTEDFNGANLEPGAACGSGAENARDFSDYPAFMRAAFRGSLRANFTVSPLGFRCARSGTAAGNEPVEPAAAGSPAGGRSLYQLDSSWTDDGGAPIRLATLRGHPVVLAMIYTGCGSVCPGTVRQMKELAEMLPAPLRASARFVLVTFDPARDTPAVLRAYRNGYSLPTENWLLLQGSPAQVRELAMALGVSYEEVRPGVFVHSRQVSILDGNGIVFAQRPTLAGGTAEAADLVARAADAPL